ncbi:unnamed protein product [Amoebophrya sp. A120]|nr:unnamed protein product [Amoebophrya sp. A120]|eukprot:GSA120T00000554001.1
MSVSGASMTDHHDGVGGGLTTIVELDFAILSALLGPEWREQRLQHLDFSDPAFALETLKIKEHEEDKAFAPLLRSKVISIDLTKNKLTSLLQLRGEDFPSLKIFRCKSNELLSENVLLALPRLKELYLGRNQLTSIPALAGLPSLEILILNHNRIQTELFGKDLAKGGKELRKIDLRGNQIANNPNNFLKSLIRLASLSNLNMFKIAENPFCGLFPEYQAVLYGFLCSAGINLRQLDRIQVAGEKDTHMLEVYEQLVTTVYIEDSATMKEYLFDAKLISPNSGKVTFDTDLPNYHGVAGGGGLLQDPQHGVLNEEVHVMAGDLLLLDGKLAGYKLETFLLANPANAFQYPLPVRFLQLSHLSTLFDERLDANMQGNKVNKLFASSRSSHKPRLRESNGQPDEAPKLPMLSQLIAYYEDVLSDPSTLMQQLELVFRLASKICVASQEEFPEIFGRERMTAVQYARWMRGLSAQEQQEIQQNDENECQHFCQVLRMVHERYAGFVSTIAPLLFRTLSKLAVVNGTGTGGLGTHCLFCLSELGKAHEQEVLDLVEEMLIPELQMISTWQDGLNDRNGVSLAETIVSGLVFFAPTEPYFRPSLLLGYHHDAAYFCKKMPNVVRKLCEFYRADRANTVELAHCAVMSPPYANLMKHCVASRDNATLSVARDTIPEMVMWLFTEQHLIVDEPDKKKSKRFKDFVKVAISMITFAREDSVRVLLPCLEIWASQIQQLARTGPLNDMAPGMCATMALLIDAVTCMMANSNEALSIIVNQANTEKGIVEKHLPFLCDIINEQIAEPLLLSASLRCFCLVLTHSQKCRDAWIELVVRPTGEKPAGVLELVLPYMGGKKYKAIYERCALLLDAPEEGKQQVVITPPLAMCYNLYVHECLIALVDFVKVFTSLANTDSFCDKMSEQLNQRGREKILFSLLSVPDETVQEAAMSCIRCVSLDELEADEIEFLVNMLDVSKQRIQGGLLSAVLNQLRELCVTEGSIASKVFRSKFVETTSNHVFEILLKNLQIVTYSKADADAKAKLSFGCLHYLLIISKSMNLRAHLRSKELCIGQMPAILKLEEAVSDVMEQDVFVERTWSGRNLEALLSCLTGPQKLSVRGPQSFRVFMRIADVLQGRPDSLEPLSELKHDAVDGKLYVDVLAEREREMFDQGMIEKEMRMLDDQEWEDRVSQHQSFATFHGLDVMLTYLETQLGTADEDILSVPLGKLVNDFGSKLATETEELATQRKQKETAEEIHFEVEYPDPDDANCKNTTDHFLQAFLETVSTDFSRDEYLVTHQTYFSEGQDRLETLLTRSPVYNDVPYVLGGANGSGTYRPVLTADQGLNTNAIVSAFLRSAYVLLTVPCAHNLKKTVMTWVRNKVTLQRLLRLVNSLSDCTEFHVASKFLRILNLSHKCGARDLEQLREVLPAEVPKSRLDVLFLWQDYLNNLMAMLVPRCKNYARTHVKLNDQQEVLSLEILLSLHLISHLLPMFSYAKYYLVHLQCLNLVFYQFFRPAIDNFIEFCLYDLRLDSLSSTQARISKDFAYSGNRRVALLDFGMEILAKCMQHSSSLKYDILEKFNKSSEVMRLPYLKQLLHLYQMSLYQSSVEILLNYGDVKLALQAPAKERVLHLLEVRFPSTKSKYHKTTALNKREHLLLCVSTKRILLLQKDTTRASYWLHPALEGPCGVCPTQAFCPKLPSVLFSHNFDKLCRVVDGWSQMLAVGFMFGAAEKTELLLLKTSPMGKRKVLDHFETLSTCGISADAMLRISPDVISESGLIFKVGDTQIVGLQFVRVRRVKNLEVARSGRLDYTMEEAADRYGREWSEALIVLTEGEFFEFVVNWDYWLPPFEEDDDDGAALQEEIRMKLRGRSIPKMANEIMSLSAKTSALDLQLTDYQLKKHADRSRIRERTEYDQFMNQAAKNQHTVEQKTREMQVSRSSARQHFMFDRVTKLSSETPSVAASGGCFVKEEDVTMREKKKKAVLRCHDLLLQNQFHASLSTLMGVEVGTQDTPAVYMKFQDETFHFQFDHDAARENFRRALALVLNQEDVVWERTFQV